MPHLIYTDGVKYLTVGERRSLLSLALPSLLCIGLVGLRWDITGTWHYWFVLENLALAWLALIFAWLLARNLKKMPWNSLPNITLSLLWLVFLPNTWYVLTDFIHIGPSGEISQLYDIVLIASLVVAGFSLGFASLYKVHTELIQRFSRRKAAAAVTIILLVASFAIYLGRDLRWNTWDVVTNPTGITLDVSDRVVNPLAYQHAWDMTGLFFVLVGTIYSSIWLYAAPKDRL